jgi:hypothetical protein
MFDVAKTSNFPTEPPLELVAPEDLVDELASEFAARMQVESRIARLLHQITASKASAMTDTRL